MPSEVSNLLDRPFVIGVLVPTSIFFIIHAFLFVYIYPAVPFFNYLSTKTSFALLGNLDNIVKVSIAGYFTLLVAIFLQLTGSQITSFFEGEHLGKLSTPLQRRQQRQFDKLDQKVKKSIEDMRELTGNKEELESIINDYARYELVVEEAEKALVEVKKSIKENETTQYMAKWQLVTWFPPDRNAIKSTWLGNIDEAHEQYLYNIYGVAINTVLRRLVMVLPKDHIRRIDNYKANRNLFVNTATLLGISGLELLLLSPFNSRWPWTLAGFAALIVLSLLCYLAAAYRAIPAAEAVKSCFETYRLKLLKQLGYSGPRDEEEEREIWQHINRTFLYGEKTNLPYGSTSQRLLPPDINEDEE